jgi:hypothetical protein
LMSFLCFWVADHDRGSPEVIGTDISREGSRAQSRTEGEHKKLCF